MTTQWSLPKRVVAYQAQPSCMKCPARQERL